MINNWILIVAVVVMVLFAYDSAMAAKTWTVGDAINTPVISGPSSGDKFGLSSVVDCTCNTPTDSDDWCDPEIPDGGSTPDSAIEATWSDGGAGGSWIGSDNTGTSVKYITPSSTGSVTLTVTFDDAGTTQHPDNSKNTNVTIDVVDAKMIFKVSSVETSEITRAGTGSFEVVDDEGDPIDGATYANWAFYGEVIAIDASNTSRTWSGTIVEEGTASCNVTFGGSTAKVSKTITVNPRSGWSISPSCTQDNDYSWGSYPGSPVPLGRNQDEDEDSPLMIWPRGDSFSEGCTSAEVASGPNIDVWYISACTFDIARETLINKYAKSGTTGYPDPPNTNWHEYNETQSVDADGCLQGVRNHEAYGTGGNGKGHQALIEDEEAETDAKTEVEDNVAYSLALLKSSIQNDVTPIDLAIAAAASDDNIDAGDNWGPSTIYYYDFSATQWNSFVFGM